MVLDFHIGYVAVCFEELSHVRFQAWAEVFSVPGKAGGVWNIGHCGGMGLSIGD